MTSTTDKGGAPGFVVATRTVSGGLVGLDSTLTVGADGVLRMSDRRFGRDESRSVPPERVRPLRDALATPEWQEIEPGYGSPVADGFITVLEGAGKRTVLASPPEEPAAIPSVLSAVLGHLDSLWPAQDAGPLAPPPVPDTPSEPNLFRLRGKGGVEIGYGVLRARGEFLDYKDRRRELTFGGEKGGIEVVETAIGRMLTVALNREQANADADLVTLTLALPRFRGGARFRTLAIRTTHATGFGRPPAEGPQQVYEALELEGTASSAD